MANLMGAISNVQQVNPTTELVAAKPGGKRGEDHSARRQHQCRSKDSRPDNPIEAASRCGPRRRQQVIPERLTQHIPSLMGARAAKTRAANLA